MTCRGKRECVGTFEDSDDLGEAGVLDDGLGSDDARWIRLDGVAVDNAVNGLPQPVVGNDGAYTWPLHLAAWMPMRMAL